MPVRQVHVREHQRHNAYTQQLIDVDDYERRQLINRAPPPGRDELGPVEHRTGPASTEGIPRVDPEDLPVFPKDKVPHMDADNMLVWDNEPGVPIKSCWRDPNAFCTQDRCTDWPSCRLHVIKYDDFVHRPQKRETRDDLVLDELCEKRWSSMDETDRTWWLGPISAVHDRTWALISWEELPGDVKVELMRTYHLAHDEPPKKPKKIYLDTAFGRLQVQGVREDSLGYHIVTGDNWSQRTFFVTRQEYDKVRAELQAAGGS